MNDTLCDTLKGLWQKRAHPEWVFPNPRTGDRYNSHPKLMRGICRRAGVRYFGFHTIRHFVASLLTDREKVGTPTISKLLRHKSLRTTELYLQKVEDNLLETVRKLDLEKTPHNLFRMVEKEFYLMNITGRDGRIRTADLLLPRQPG